VLKPTLWQVEVALRLQTLTFTQLQPATHMQLMFHPSVYARHGGSASVDEVLLLAHAAAAAASNERQLLVHQAGGPGTGPCHSASPPLLRCHLLDCVCSQ